MRKTIAGLAMAVGFVAAVPARAALVDFTDSTLWPSGTGYVDYGSLRVHVSATGALTFTGFDGNGAAAPCTTTLACGNDGIGIGDDEVTYGGNPASLTGEVLTVSFTDLSNNPVSVDVLGIHIFDLFEYLAGADAHPETAQWLYSTGAGDSITGSAVGAGTGYASSAVNVSGVQWIRFYTNSPSKSNSDFALAALEVDGQSGQAVPEPATLALLGAGLLGLGARRRRRS